MNIWPTRFFKHYKNKHYRYLGIAKHSETLEDLVVYETLYENKLGRLWVRPKEMFFENVIIEGVNRPRFEKIEFKFQEEGLRTSAAVQNAYLACFSTPFNNEKLVQKTKQHNNFLLLTAYDGDQLVAFKYGYALSDKLYYSWIGGVLPEYRKLGLASELMKRQHQWCISKGFSKVRTKTRNQFKDMIQLNLNSGFNIISTETDQNGEIKIILEKNLGEQV